MDMQCKTCGHQMSGFEVLGYVLGGWFIKLEERFATRGWEIGKKLNALMIGFAVRYRVVCPVCDKPGAWGRVYEDRESVQKKNC